MLVFYLKWGRGVPWQILTAAERHRAVSRAVLVHAGAVARGRGKHIRVQSPLHLEGGKVQYNNTNVHIYIYLTILWFREHSMTGHPDNL